MKLKTEHLFMAARLIKSANLRPEIESIFKGGGTQNEMGMSLLMAITEKLGDSVVGGEIAEFLAQIVGVTKDEYLNQGIETTVNQIKQIAEENNLASFFKFAGKSQKK